MSEQKMKPEVKEKWVAALRSDEFDQTTGYLQDGNGYCCLGVLCELAIREGIIAKEKLEGGGETESNPTYLFGPKVGSPAADHVVSRTEGDTQVLPKAVSEWAGIVGNDPGVDVPCDDHEEFDPHCIECSHQDLTELNDSGESFKSIAGWIEHSL